MIFRPELAAAIVAGRKTVTRRRRSTNARSPWWEGRCSYDVGQVFAVQPGRGKPRVANARVQEVRAERLGAIDQAEARREGFGPTLPRLAFEDAWVGLHGSFDPLEVVWVVRFELIRAPGPAERAHRAELAKAHG